MMQNLARRFITPPQFADEEKNSLARLLHVILLALFPFVALAMLLQGLEGHYASALYIALGSIPLAIAVWLTHLGRLRGASFFLLLALLFLSTFLLWVGEGLQAIVLLLYPMMVIIGSLLLERRAFIFLTIMGCLSLGLVAYGEILGMVGTTPRAVEWVLNDLGTAILVLIVTAFTVYVLANNVRQNLRKARQNEQSIKESNRQLQNEIAERRRIEAELHKYTAQLETLRQWGLELAAELDLNTVLHTIVSRGVTLMRGSAGSIALYRPECQVLEWTMAVAPDQSHVGTTIQRGEGLAGKVWETGAPVLVDDYSKWQGHSRCERSDSIAMVGVPIRWGKEFLGVLAIEDCTPHIFSSEDADLLAMLATQAAVAIVNARLYAQLQQRAEQLATLNEIGRAVSMLQGLDSVLETIYRSVRRIVPTDAFYVCLYDANREEISFPLMYDSGMRYVEPTRPLRPETWIAQVIHTGKAFILHRTAKDLDLPLTHGMGDAQRKSASVLIVPMWLSKTVTGVLSVQSYTMNVYTDEHAEILTGIGHQAAIAIENARLYDQVHQELAERKRAQAEREKLIRELKAKNTELERFTYTVSHDLKSPLITIRSFLNFLEKDVASGDHAGVAQDARRITDATEKMRRLLDELLELSRIGRLTNPPEQVPFKSIAREAVALVQGQLAAKNIRVEIAPDLPIIYGDRVRLVEALQNLIENAAKFMNDQPQPRIAIGVRSMGDNAPPVFFVQDNGEGIDSQFHEKIFELFNKINPTSEGTGLGLALVKRIVEAHEGHIWVESEGIGKGAAFCFTLSRGALKSE